MRRPQAISWSRCFTCVVLCACVVFYLINSSSLPHSIPQSTVVARVKHRFGLVSACVLPKRNSSLFTRETVELSLLNKLDYCALHSATTACHVTTESDDLCVSFKWQKAFSLLRYMDQHEWLLWVDGDALIANMATPLEYFVRQAQPQEDVILIKDGQFYNTGVMMIRRSSWSKWLLTEMLSLRDWMEWMHGTWRDQKALIILLERYPNIRSHMRIVAGADFNSFPSRYQPGHFVYHQVNCKSHRRPPKEAPQHLHEEARARTEAKISACRANFTAHARRVRAEGRALNSSAGFPSAEVLDLREEADAWPSLITSVGCYWRRLLVLHRSRDQPMVPDDLKGKRK